MASLLFTCAVLTACGSSSPGSPAGVAPHLQATTPAPYFPEPQAASLRMAGDNFDRGSALAGLRNGSAENDASRRGNASRESWSRLRADP